MDDRGSILVETLVASAIVALVLGVALQTIGDSARRADLADAAAASLVEVRSRLIAAGVEAPLVPGSTGGTDGDLVWRMEVAPYDTGGGAGPAMRVSVTAFDPRRARSRVTLSSLRLTRP